jgi:hypothetical protein
VDCRFWFFLQVRSPQMALIVDYAACEPNFISIGNPHSCLFGERRFSLGSKFQCWISYENRGIFGIIGYEGALCTAANSAFSDSLLVWVSIKFCWSSPLQCGGRRHVRSQSTNAVSFAAYTVLKARTYGTSAVDMKNILYGLVAPGNVRYLAQSLRSHT